MGVSLISASLCRLKSYESGRVRVKHHPVVVFGSLRICFCQKSYRVNRGIGFLFVGLDGSGCSRLGVTQPLYSISETVPSSFA